MLLLAVFIIVLTVYAIYVYRLNKHWKARGVKELEGNYWYGSLLDTSSPYTVWYYKIAEYTKKFGKIWGYRNGAYPTLVIADIDLAQEVLVKRFEEFQQRTPNNLFSPKNDAPRVHLADAHGSRWKRLRTIITPQFSNIALKRVLPKIEDCVQDLCSHLGKKTDGTPINIHRYYQEFTMDVIARIAMGEKESVQWTGQYTEILKAFFERDMRFGLYLTASVLPPFKYVFAEFYKVLAKFVEMPDTMLLRKIEHAVYERKKQRENGISTSNDFIDLFLDAEAEEIDHSTEAGFDRREVQSVSRKLTAEEVVGQCFVFLLAGFDTTSNSLAQMAYHLSNRQDVIERMRDEIDAVCTTKEVTYEQLNELKYIDFVSKETLRLNPLATIAVQRVAAHDTELGGVKLAKGDNVLVDCYTLSRSREIWGDDALEFNPDRWDSVTKEQTQAYLTFGGGPRVCVGKRLAYIEMKLALVHVLRQFDILPPPRQEPLKLYGAITMSPTEVNVCLRRRST